MNSWGYLKGGFLSNWIQYESTVGEIIKSEKKVYRYKKRSAKARIEFGYIVDGEFYVSHLVNFAGNLDDYEYFLGKYPTGKQVKVFYEKNKPSFAVLEPDNWSVRVIISPVLIGFAFMVNIFLWFRKVRSDQSK